MNEIFIDGIRSIAVVNGVARIELLQLKRGTDQNKLEPYVVATLMVPAASLREMAAHLTTSLQRIEASAEKRAEAAKAAPSKGPDLDDALGNL